MFPERRASIVYLTADSPHELACLAEEDVYVIGGIVDRNRHKNLTLEQATAAGVRHARLPIQAHMKMTGSHVLTVNQVFELLLAWLELRDWRAACERAVPKRKRGGEGGAAGGEEGEEGDADEDDDDAAASKAARVAAEEDEEEEEEEEEEGKPGEA
jgi:tRNA (guanine9-N1)-methyltransferase